MQSKPRRQAKQLLQHRWVAAATGQTPCWKLQRNFWAGSSSSLGTLEKQAVPQAQTPSSSWMPQAQMPRWRWRQPAATPQKQLITAGGPCHRPRCHAGSCSGTFETPEKEAVPQAQTLSWVPQAQTASWRWTASGYARRTVDCSRGALPETPTPCRKLQRNFWGGSSSSLGRLKK